MQATLGGCLALSILLAWLVMRQHTRALTPTQWQDRTAGGLYMRLPANWQTRSHRLPGAAYCLATEPKPTLGVKRELAIIQERLDKPISSLDFAYNQDNRVTPEDAQRLDFLGHEGVIVQTDAEEVGMRQERLGRLFAAVTLPSGIGVYVELVGPRIFVPADRQLVEQVAKSLKEMSGEGHGVAVAE